MKPEPSRSFTVDCSKLPPLYPTHLHDAAFWCSLGRAVATFGYLEEMLKQAVFALTGSVPVPATGQDEAVEQWGKLLERTIVMTLSPLIDNLAKAVKEHPKARIDNLDEFIQHLRDAAKMRNVICHSSWKPPAANGSAQAFYVTGKPGDQRVLGTPVTVEWLDQLREHTAELACEVINTVTHMGYQFPGGNGPGRPVL